MKLSELSDSELVVDAKGCVLRERQAALAVFERLREISRRGLHLSMGYSSLHEFCVAELGYSDGAAYRRIHAMRLCGEMPEARQATADGTLSLCTAASLENYFKKDGAGLGANERKDLFQAVQGKSKTECERLLYPERTGKKIEFLADDETLEDLNRLCELMAIAPHDMATLIKRIAKIARRSIDPILKTPRRRTASPEKLEQPMPDPAPVTTKPQARRRSIPWALRHEIWLRDKSQCTYTDTLSGRRCSGRYGLQIDHRTPVACGGTNEADNLRLLCFAHNQYAADRVYGRDKMTQHRLFRESVLDQQ